MTSQLQIVAHGKEEGLASTSNHISTQSTHVHKCIGEVNFYTHTTHIPAVHNKDIIA